MHFTLEDSSCEMKMLLLRLLYQILGTILQHCEVMIVLFIVLEQLCSAWWM